MKRYQKLYEYTKSKVVPISLGMIKFRVDMAAPDGDMETAGKFKSSWDDFKKLTKNKLIDKVKNILIANEEDKDDLNSFTYDWDGDKWSIYLPRYGKVGEIVIDED